MRTRNWFYKAGFFHSQSFPVPIINIGNITVGGTGKTPHTEYVARLLQEKYTVALLSRGYKRKTSGFILADQSATAGTIGDEPFQMKQNLGKNIIIAVDTDRRRGIKNLLKLQPEIDVILLDDAYQHRRVAAGLNILLVDYNRPIYRDKLLPAGNLRESVAEKKRADIIIFSKCPNDITPIDIRIATTDLNPQPYQNVFFSTYCYGDLRHISDNNKKIRIEELSDKDILLVTGIAQPQPLRKYLEMQTKNLRAIHYADHYNFNHSDIAQIEREFFAQPDSLIITTEKDAARLQNHLTAFTEECLSAIYVLPIEVKILQDKKMQFDKKIMDFVKRG